VRRGWTGATIGHEDEGSVLVETALGVALILSIALPFASLVSYATYAARDLAAAQGAVRAATRSERATATDGSISFTCGTAPDATDGPCATPLVRGTYVAAAKDTTVSLPFGLALHTAERAVARVE
jgi:hypothetical protein